MSAHSSGLASCFFHSLSARSKDRCGIGPTTGEECPMAQCLSKLCACGCIALRCGRPATTLIHACLDQGRFRQRESIFFMQAKPWNLCSGRIHGSNSVCTNRGLPRAVVVCMEPCVHLAVCFAHNSRCLMPATTPMLSGNLVTIPSGSLPEKPQHATSESEVRRAIVFTLFFSGEGGGGAGVGAVLMFEKQLTFCQASGPLVPLPTLAEAPEPVEVYFRVAVSLQTVHCSMRGGKVQVWNREYSCG